MTTAALADLALIATIAVLAPVLAHFTRRFGLPGVVIEIALGIVIGPGLLNWANGDGVVAAFSAMGLTMLMFLAGYELDLSRVAGRPLKLAGFGWAGSLILAVALALILGFADKWQGDLLVALAISTTALGTLLPALRDSGIIRTPLGSNILAIGTFGEFGPILLLAVLFTANGAIESLILLAGFGILAVGAGFAVRMRWARRLTKRISKELHSSSQLPIRVAMLLNLLLVWLAAGLGLDVLLGAFAAGVLVRLAVSGDRDAEGLEIFQGKLEAIGFGLFIPAFFIVSGIHFDIQAFITDPQILFWIPVFLGLMLLARGMPILLGYRLPVRERVGLAVLAGTGLPLIVVITTIGTSDGYLPTKIAAALVGAGMLSVVLFPAIGASLLRNQSATSTTTRPPKESRSPILPPEEAL